MDFSELVKLREIVCHTLNLGDDDLAVLCEVLEKTKDLETLNLSCNHLTLEDGSFTSALSRNTTLKELYLNHNKIGPEGGRLLGKALQPNRTLEKLSLDGNRLGDAAAGHIADLLDANDALEHLSLSANQIGERGAGRLSSALARNRGLRALVVRGNAFGPVGASDFLVALQGNNTVGTLHVGTAKDPAQQKIERILASPERKIRVLETALATKDDLVKEMAKKDSEIAKKDAQIAKKDAEIAEKDAQISKRDKAMVNMGRVIESRDISTRIQDAKIEKKDAEIAKRDRVIVTMGRDIESKEIQLSTLRTHLITYAKEAEAEPQQSEAGRKRSSELLGDVLAALSDVGGVMDEAEDLRTLTVYTGMMLGLLDSEKRKVEVEHENDVPLEDEGCFTTKDVECHIGDLSIEDDNPVTHVSHERWTKEGLAVVVVGASGDLAKKKTYPSLLSLYAGGLLPKDLAVYGFARSDMSDEDLRKRLRPYLAEKKDARLVEEFLGRCFYQAGAGYGDGGAWKELDGKLRAREGVADGKWNRLFYFAIPPNVFAETGEAIKMNCMAPGGFSRMIVEKPFGRDLDSCKHILHQLGQHFDETNLFRIDHYLGKEMTQNLMVMRFGNVWMEHMWNRDYVQCIMLTFKEPFGTDGRGGYFDKYGIIRDIIQNHLLQVMCLLCMESPNKLDGEGAGEKIRDEKVRVIQAMQEVTLDDVFLGQYAGYSNDPTITNKDTNCPTFAMVRCFINNPRWAGVPIIFKAGKALNERKAEMRVQFKDAPAAAALFGTHVSRNEVVVKLQPEESIYMKSNIKTPGFSSAPIQSELEVKYDTRYFGDGTTANPDAYSRLILDVLRGRSANFVRSDELIRAWEIFTPVLHQIERENILPHIYKSGSRGPETADAWFKEKSGYVRNEAYAYIDGKVAKKAS